MPRRSIVLAALLVSSLAACSGEHEGTGGTGQGVEAPPPFEVRGEAEGLMLVWFDADGLHTASRRSEIPEDHRAMVRVDDLSLPPEGRLDPELVYVADLSSAGPDGTYPVRRVPRARFDSRVEQATAAEVEVAEEEPEAEARAADADADVIIYGASWCSACRSTKAFLREHGIPFVERDIEREPGARQAMLEAARAAGVSPRGIPVIDFRGQIIAGFNPEALQRAIDRSTAAM